MYIISLFILWAVLRLVIVGVIVTSLMLAYIEIGVGGGAIGVVIHSIKDVLLQIDLIALWEIIREQSIIFANEVITSLEEG